MVTLTLRVRADHAGVVKLEIPDQQPDTEVEIVLVMQSAFPQPVDAMGYPIGYFEQTYGSFADEPLTRDQPPPPDVVDDHG
ncbi:MAG: hypothetical protein SGJ24_00575 [Chloroflexota bacterium]|nr:hypothetical protein [Chloroflexota bacterium]